MPETDQHPCQRS